MHEDLRDLEPALTRIEHNVHPYMAFLVRPLFALSNAGVVSFLILNQFTEKNAAGTQTVASGVD